MTITKVLICVYGFVNKTGLLDSHWFRKNIFLPLYFFYKKYSEDPFYALIKLHPEFFREGNILDIGANVGYTAILFSKVLTKGFNVYSFEPDYLNILLLKESLKTFNALEKVIPFQIALGESNGVTKLWHNIKDHANHKILTEQFKNRVDSQDMVTEVKLNSVDAFLKEKNIETSIKFIKIDVQGYELPVCKGMENTLANNPNLVIAIEYSPSDILQLGFKPNELLGFFYDRNYFISIINRNGKLSLASVEDIEKVVKKRGYVDLLCSKDKNRCLT